MKLLISLLLILVTDGNITKNRQLFNDFHTIYAKADFAAMKQLLADDFVGLNENGYVSFKKAGYISYMAEWNQVFKTKWTIDSVKEEGGVIKSIEHDSDMYIDYFYGGDKKLTQYTYTFKEGKIKSIQIVPTEKSNQLETVFQERFGNFYAWVQKNYPDKLTYLNAYTRRAALEVKAMLEQYLSIINGSA